MPIVDIHVIRGVFSRDEKQQLMSRVSDVVADIAGEGLKPHTTVRIVEVDDSEWSVGGKILTAEDVNRMRSSPRSQG